MSPDIADPMFWLSAEAPMALSLFLAFLLVRRAFRLSVLDRRRPPV